MEIKSSSISHIEIKSISTTHAKTKSSSMLTLQPSDFWPAYKNQVTCNHPHKNQVNRSRVHVYNNSFPTRTKTSTPNPALKPSQCQSTHEKQVNSDLYTKIKSNSISHIEIKSILTTHAETKPSSMLTLNHVVFGPHTKNKSIATTHTKTKSIHLHVWNKTFPTRTNKKSIAIPELKPSQSRSIHEPRTIIGPNTTKSVSTPRTKTTISIHTQQPCQFRSVTQKTSCFRPHHWNQVNFDLHSNIKSISMPWHKNRVNFDPEIISTATQ